MPDLDPCGSGSGIFVVPGFSSSDPVPGLRGLETPSDLNGTVREEGNVIEKSRWTHVIAVEPERDAQAESAADGHGAIVTARPFPVRP